MEHPTFLKLKKASQLYDVSYSKLKTVCQDIADGLFKGEVQRSELLPPEDVLEKSREENLTYTWELSSEFLDRHFELRSSTTDGESESNKGMEGAEAIVRNEWDDILAEIRQNKNALSKEAYEIYCASFIRTIKGLESEKQELLELSRHQAVTMMMLPQRTSESQRDRTNEKEKHEGFTGEERTNPIDVEALNTDAAVNTDTADSLTATATEYPEELNKEKNLQSNEEEATDLEVNEREEIVPSLNENKSVWTTPLSELLGRIRKKENKELTESLV